MKHVFIVPLIAGFAVGCSLFAQQPKPQDASFGSPATASPRASASCKASQLIGCAITNSKNESLGEIQDIVLDAGNQRIAYAVVGFGGFLGMGEKYFAMPWRLIEVGMRSGEDKPRATLGLDQATLKAAPGFDKGMWPDMANPAWAQQVDDYYRNRNEAVRPEGASEPKGSGIDGRSGIDRAPGSKGFAHRRLSRLIGMTVVDAQQRTLAEVEDLVVEPKQAVVEGVLLSFGGMLGMGEHLALVSADALTLDHEKNVFVFHCSKSMLEDIALPGGKWPTLDNSDWLVASRAYCAKARDAQSTVIDGHPVEASASVPFADFYDQKRIETVKGTISTVGVVRIGDSKEERVRLRVRTTEGREVIVYAAPSTYAEQDVLVLTAGQTIEVMGSPAKYGNQTVLVAGSLQQNGKTVQLRDEQGRATWTKK